MDGGWVGALVRGVGGFDGLVANSIPNRRQHERLSFNDHLRLRAKHDATLPQTSQPRYLRSPPVATTALVEARRSKLLRYLRIGFSTLRLTRQLLIERLGRCCTNRKSKRPMSMLHRATPATACPDAHREAI